MDYEVAIDESAEGMRVVAEGGVEVGVVSAVRDGTVYVDPNPGVAETITSKLGWGGVEAGNRRLPEESIERIADGEVHVRTEF